MANILPNDPGILYSPGTWSVTAASADTINDGAYFRTLITGSPSAITLAFNVAGQTTTNMVGAWRVDGGGWTRFQVAASVALTLPAASGMWTSRLVEVAYAAHDTGLWDESEAMRFAGFATTPASCTASLPARRPLRGLVFGDSITNGSNVFLTSGSPYPANSDATLGYAFRLQDTLGAEVGVVAFPGVDVTQGSGNIPATGGTYNLLWGGGPARSFAGLDFIAINLGTNGRTSTAAAYKAAYQAFLNQLLAAAPPPTRLFCILPFGGYQAAAIQAAIAACSAPARVGYVDTTGWWNTADSGDALHPWGDAHLASLAPRTGKAVLGGLLQTYLFSGSTLMAFLSPGVAALIQSLVPTVPLATATTPGLVMPDGSTMTVGTGGILHAVQSGGGGTPAWLSAIGTPLLDLNPAASGTVFADAAMTTAATAGGAVQAWRDANASGPVFSATSNTPTFVTNAFGSLPGVRFTPGTLGQELVSGGTGQTWMTALDTASFTYMLAFNAVAMPSGSNLGILLAVVQASAEASFVPAAYACLMSSSLLAGFNYPGGPGSNGPTKAFAAGVARAIAVRFNASTRTLRITTVDGTTASAVSNTYGSAPAFDRACLGNAGNRSDANNAFNGTLGRALLWQVEASDAQVAAALNGMASTYGAS